MKKTNLLIVLRNRDFLRIWLAQILSLMTAQMLNFILIERIFRATGSTVAIGLFFVLYYLPTVLLGPFAGVFIDRWNKKKILVFSNLSQALIVLFYLGLKERVWPIYAIVLLYSLSDEFFNPAVGVCLPAIVDKKGLPIANGFFLLTTQMSLAAGFLMGGLLLRFLKPGYLVFLLASWLLLLAALAASGLSGQVLKKRKTSLDLGKFQEEFIRGYQFIKNEPLVFFPIMLLTFLQVFLGMTAILLPSISHQLLHISLADASVMLIIPAFLGVILGSLLVEKLAKEHRKKHLITLGLFASGLSMISFGWAVPVFKFPLVLGIILVAALGMAFALMFVPSQTLVQEHTPFGVRGRVFAALSSLVNLAAVAPMLVTASLVDFFGVRAVLLAMALVIMALGFYALRGRYGVLGVNHRA